MAPPTITLGGVLLWPKCIIIELYQKDQSISPKTLGYSVLLNFFASFLIFVTDYLVERLRPRPCLPHLFPSSAPK
jgi:hypothetical protein